MIPAAGEQQLAMEPSTGSAAQHVAELAPNAHVVKALHLLFTVREV
jgi:predicted dinucleotide-binding enzyme